MNEIFVIGGLLGFLCGIFSGWILGFTQGFVCGENDTVPSDIFWIKERQ